MAPFNKAEGLAKVSQARKNRAETNEETAGISEVGMALVDELVENLQNKLDVQAQILRAQKTIDALGGKSMASPVLKFCIDKIANHYARRSKSQLKKQAGQDKKETKMRAGLVDRAAERVEAEGVGLKRIMTRLEGAARKLRVGLEGELGWFGKLIKIINNLLDRRAKEYNGKHAKKAAEHFSKAQKFRDMAATLKLLAQGLNGEGEEPEAITEKRKKEQEALDTLIKEAELADSTTEGQLLLVKEVIHLLSTRAGASNTQDIVLPQFIKPAKQ